MIKLSVCMLAYNHEKYIGQAIESVMMQETDFDYALVIGEDCSPDHTREIVLKYKRLYPEKITLILQDHNVGASLNEVEVAQKCDTPYIAFLEGDDYWTDKKKLQQAVDFLDHHPDYIATAHDVHIVDENHNRVADTPYGSYKGDLLTPKDQFKYNNLPSLSLVIRNIWGADYYRIRQEMAKNVEFVTDYPFKLLLLCYGKIKYFDKKMGTYRWINDCGSSFSAIQKKQMDLSSIDIIHGLENLSDMNTSYTKLFKKKALRLQCDLVLFYLYTFETAKLKRFIADNFFNQSFFMKMKIFFFLICLLIYKVPRRIFKAFYANHKT